MKAKDRLIITISLAMLVIMFFICFKTDGQYTSRMSVTNIDKEVVEFNGKYECYLLDSDYKVGQFVKLKMDDNGTFDYPDDDIIIKVIG